VLVAGVPMQAHSVLSVALPRLEREDHSDASALFTMVVAARLRLLRASVSVIQTMSVARVPIEVLATVWVMTLVTVESVAVLTATATVTTCVSAAAMDVKVAKAAVKVVVARGRRKFLVQKLCAGAYEESRVAALYG